MSDLREPLAMFEAVYLDEIEFPMMFTKRLADAGFKEVLRKRSMDPYGETVERALFQAEGLDCGIQCTFDDAGQPADVGLVVPQRAGMESQLMDYVLGQPNVFETTQDISHLFAFAPEDVSWNLVRSRFWSSKAVGKVGVNWVLGPALLDFADGTTGLALSASRNLALQDMLDADGLAAPTGRGSDLAKFALIFSELAIKVCPDLSAIIDAADAYGYAGEVEGGATSFILAGGRNPGATSRDMTSAIHVNSDTSAAFEFALTFILDERIEPANIRAVLADHMGIGAAALATGTAEMEIAGAQYSVEHRIESAAFGNHAFLLYR